MSPESRLSDNAVPHVLYDQQQQQQRQQQRQQHKHPTTPMLDHQSIELEPSFHHGNTASTPKIVTLQPPLPISSATPISFNKAGPSNTKMYSDCNTTEEEKRQQLLEKNRLAALKCRQRKKAWVEELAKKSDQAMHQNALLKRMISQLKEDVLFLKSQLLAHRGCQCQVINNYIKGHMLDSFQRFESIQPNSSNQCYAASPYTNSFQSKDPCSYVDR